MAEYMAQDPDFESLHEHPKWGASLEKAKANEAAVQERRQKADAAITAAELELSEGTVEKARELLAPISADDAAEKTRFLLLRARTAASPEQSLAFLSEAISAGLVEVPRAPELEPVLSSEAGAPVVAKILAARAELQKNVTWERAGLDEGPLVIGLHGYGESATTLCTHLAKAMPKSRVVCPPGPTKADGGGRGWIDLQRTQAVLDVVLKTTVRGADKPLLVGFSQGAWLGLREVLSRPERYRAAIIIGTSRFEPPDDATLARVSKSEVRVIFVAGSSDPAAMRAARSAYDLLTENGVPAEKLFAVGLSHELPPLVVLQEARKFIDAPDAPQK
jgi:predicted esterase